YDDLKQRHRERIIKRTIAIVSSVAAVVAIAGAAFGIYNANVAEKMRQLANEKAALADEKSRLAEEITVQYEGKLENQSRFYAQEALSLFESGNREDAILIAMEGLPSETDDRPYVAEAEYALSRALYAYDSGHAITFDRILQHDLTVDKMTTSEDKGLIITVDNGNKVYVWDTDDWSLKVCVEPFINENGYYTIVDGTDADETGVYVATDRLLIKYDFEGKALYQKQFSDTIRLCDSCADTGKLVVVCDDAFYVLDTSNGNILETFKDTTGMPFMGAGRYYKDNGLFITTHYDASTPRSFISVYDLNNGTFRDIGISEGYYLDSCLTPGGNIAVVSCNANLVEDGVTHVVTDLVSPEGDMIWTKDLDAHIRQLMTFNTFTKAHAYTKNGEEHSDIVVAIEAQAYTLDEKDGSFVAKFTLPGDASALSLVLNSQLGRVGYRQGNFDLIDFSEGRIYSEHTFITGESIREWVVINDKLAYSSMASPEVHVVTWHEAPDIEDFTTFETDIAPAGVAPDGSYFAVRPEDDYQTYIFFDADGTELYRYEGDKFINDIKLCNGKAVITDSQNLIIVDPFEKKAEKIPPADYGFSEYSFECYINKEGSKCVVWTSRDLMVFDIVNKSVIFEHSYDENPGDMIMSEDGSRIYVSKTGRNMYAIDTTTGDILEFKDDVYKTIAEGYYKDYSAVSPDGRYVAVCCVDGMMRVADTTTFEEYAEAEMQSYLRSYVSFTDDGKYIVAQGDDYRIHIFDMEKRSFINTVDGAGSIDHIVCDEKSGLMAVSSGYSMFLFETKGYGRVAYANNGIEYLKSNGSMLISNDMTEVKRTYYKNYNELVKLAKEQFPNASLNEEKKAKYNIN
nr:hypothetical protein [Lachnospiraceae bacterium]